MRERRARRGAIAVEFALAFAGVVLPATLALIFTSQILWTWHAVNDFTRRGAGYAATHCWRSSASNVLDFMRLAVPPVLNQDQFQNGPVVIDVSYYARDPDSGALLPFQCDGDCTTGCIPDTVTVRVTGYEVRAFTTFLGLPAIVLPDFQTTVPIESAGCDPEQGICNP